MTERQMDIIKAELIPLITKDITRLMGRVIEKRLTVYAEEMSRVLIENNKDELL